jgi:hypothetical protein
MEWWCVVRGCTGARWCADFDFESRFLNSIVTFGLIYHHAALLLV